MKSAPAILPRRRSLALWALLSLAMVLGSYVLILLTAAACVYLPYLALMHTGTPGLQTIALLLCGVAMAATMVWSLVPRRDKFLPPGPLLDRTAHPRLFAELEDLANLLDEPVPNEVYLIPEVNAFVADRGGVMGFGTRRVMGIGLPLVAILEQSEFRAVLVHEFGHYYSGDTRLGPWVYKTRMAMVRTIQNMASLGSMMRVAVAQIAYRFVMLILEAYWKVFFRATQGISRRQEYRADELACHLGGTEPLVNGLRKIHAANAAFPAYWGIEVVPLLNVGYRPAIAEGFRLFVSAPEVSSQIEEHLKKELEHTRMQVYDSHPPLRDRIAAAQHVVKKPSQRSSEAATALFGDLLAEETRIFTMSNSESKIAELKTFAWEDLPAILLNVWREVVATQAEFLDDVTTDSLFDIIPRLPEIGARIPDPKGMLLTPEQRTARATELFGLALALALVDAGWRLHMKPGERYYECGSERVSVRGLMNDLVTRKIARDEWIRRCQELRVAGIRLARPAKASGAVPV